MYAISSCDKAYLLIRREAKLGAGTLGCFCSRNIILGQVPNSYLSRGSQVYPGTRPEGTPVLKDSHLYPVCSGAAFNLNRHNSSISFLFCFYFSYGPQFCTARSRIGNYFVCPCCYRFFRQVPEVCIVAVSCNICKI